VVRLDGVDGRVLHVDGVDMLDGTPLLDIKPYVPEFEGTEDVRIGWLAQARGRIRDQRADDRFG
jgi:tRNA (Thr-GGU) A37 N-methylase